MIEQHAFGDSGLIVTPIGLGLAALGRPGYINLGHGDSLGHNYDIAAMEQRAHRVLDAAWAAGVRYFDAARSYGRAEEFLGSWLRDRSVDPASVTVGSKWGYTYIADWQVQAAQHEVKEHSLAVLARQWAESQAALGDQLDLYQIHSATLESGVLENRDVLNELARLKRAGMRIGLSLSGPRQADTLRAAIGVTVDGVRLFDGVQATWNLLEPSAGPALAEAAAAGMGVIVKEALANGRLTPANSDAAFAPQMTVLTHHARRLGITIDALALAAVLAQPWLNVALSGVTNSAHLISNLAALSVTLDEEVLRDLTTLAETSTHYWRTRANLPWN